MLGTRPMARSLKDVTWYESNVAGAGQVSMSELKDYVAEPRPQPDGGVQATLSHRLDGWLGLREP